MIDTGKINNDVFKDYLHFVAERHKIWEARQRGEPGPWTDDPVLQGRKFTNVFRALDWGSQFLINELFRYVYPNDVSMRDIVVRAFLYRYTNRPDPWEFYYEYHGRYPRTVDLDAVEETWELFRTHGGGVFGNAYTMFSGAENKGMSRVEWLLGLARQYFTPDSPNDVIPALVKTSSVAERLAILQTVPRCADFMSMQVATDIGYSSALPSDENEIILAGPGAKRGIAAFAPGEDPVAVIHYVRDALPGWLGDDTPRIILPDGRERFPSLLDVQNTFCELSKYLRYKYKPGAGRRYSPAHGQIPPPVLPDHW